jgi:hypothetical protein
MGVDRRQWRALVAAYLSMDLRRGGGAFGRRIRRGGDARPLLAALIFMVMAGGVFAAIAIGLPDVQVAASLLTTYGAINTAMLLLVEFNAIVLSPDDYAVLGHRPVDSRTYFAARLAAVVAYIAMLAAALAVLPALTFALWRDFGVAAFVAVVAAVVLCNVVITVLVVTGYVSIAIRVHPGRIRRVTTYLQLLSAILFYGSYFLATLAFRDSFLHHMGFGANPWLWANPASWFGAFVTVSAGGASRADWIACGGAAALCALAVPLAAGRLSLEYAQRIGEMQATPDPRSGRQARRRGLPGFRRGEARAIALLIGAQFRHDQRFRLAILGMIPLMGFYLLLGLNDGALVDPFTTTHVGGGPLYVAVVFIPMTLHASLQVSESWRAAWIFFAAPASAARLVVAAKNYVAVFFLGAYLLFLALIWVFFFERAWHAVFHAAVLGSLAHILLQLTVLVGPAMPFAAEPRRGQQSSRVLGVLLAASVVTPLVSFGLPYVYASAAMTAAVVVGIAALTAFLEFALRLRVADAIKNLEFAAS